MSNFTSTEDNDDDEFTDFASTDVPNTSNERVGDENQLNSDSSSMSHTEQEAEGEAAILENEGAQALTGTDAYELRNPLSNGNDNFGEFDSVQATDETQINNGKLDDGERGDLAEETGVESLEPALVDDANFGDFGGYEYAADRVTASQDPTQKDVFGDFGGARGDRADVSGDEQAEPVLVGDDFGGFGGFENGELAATSQNPPQEGHDEFGNLVIGSEQIEQTLSDEDDVEKFAGFENAELATASLNPQQEDNGEFGGFEVADGDIAGESGYGPNASALVDGNKDVFGEFSGLATTSQTPTRKEFDDFDGARADTAEESCDEQAGQAVLGDLAESVAPSQDPTQEEFGGIDGPRGYTAEGLSGEPTEPALIDDDVDEYAGSENAAEPATANHDEFGDFDGARGDNAEEMDNEQAEPALVEDDKFGHVVDQSRKEQDSGELRDSDRTREDTAEPSFFAPAELALVDSNGNNDLSAFGGFENAELATTSQNPTQEDDGEFGGFDAACGVTVEEPGDDPDEPADDGNLGEVEGTENAAEQAATSQNSTQEDDGEFDDFDELHVDIAQESNAEPAGPAFANDGHLGHVIEESRNKEEDNEFGDFNETSGDIAEESGAEQAEQAQVDSNDSFESAEPATTSQFPQQEDDDDFGDFDGASGAIAQVSAGEQAGQPLDDDDDDFGGFENATEIATTSQSPKQEDDDFGDFGEAENEAVDQTQAREVLEIGKLSDRARLKFQDMFGKYAREHELATSEETSAEIVSISSILEQELEAGPGKNTSINLLEVLGGPREESSAPPFAFISSRSGSYSSRPRYQSWISKFKSPNAPFSLEKVFLPSDKSSKASQGELILDKRNERGDEKIYKTPTPEVKHQNHPAPKETIVQLPSAAPRETIVQLPPLPAKASDTSDSKASASQSERVAEFLKQIPDLSYMLSSKLSSPSS